jgi:hypothetical protein
LIVIIIIIFFFVIILIIVIIGTMYDLKHRRSTLIATASSCQGETCESVLVSRWDIQRSVAVSAWKNAGISPSVEWEKHGENL